jgi:hypothetical protein
VVASLHFTLWLGVYSTIVSTAVALLTLFGEIFPRVRVEASERLLVTVSGKPMLVSDRATVATMGGAPNAGREVLAITVRIRGRRDFRIENVVRRVGLGRELLADASQQIPGNVLPGHSANIVNGAQGGYKHGDISPRWWYVVDGGDRIYPLRIRSLLRLEDVLYRRAILWLRKWRRRQ